MAAVLTIPLTSAVCSKAAVIYVQRRGQRMLSLRQTMTLADKGWTEPEIFLKLMTGSYKRYGSWFLLLAIAVHILGPRLEPQLLWH